MTYSIQVSKYFSGPSFKDNTFFLPCFIVHQKKSIISVIRKVVHLSSKSHMIRGTQLTLYAVKVMQIYT